MNAADLNNTKQRQQIKMLVAELEKNGWKIINEERRRYGKVLRWELNDEIPNLICTWTLQKAPTLPTRTLDFIAWWDYVTYRTETNNCECCNLRDTSITLNFVKDKSLEKAENLKKWKNALTEFCKTLNNQT